MRKIATSKSLAKVIIHLFSLFSQFMNSHLQVKYGSVLLPSSIN